MPEAPASTGSLQETRFGFVARVPWFNRRASALLCNGSVQNKSVRFGTLEPAHLTLAKQSILPALAVFTLAICMRAAHQEFSREFYALGLVAFLICGQVFSPLDLRSHTDTARLYKAASKKLLEWCCVVAILMFLSVSFKLTPSFPRSVIVSLVHRDAVCDVARRLLEHAACQVARIRTRDGATLYHHRCQRRRARARAAHRSELRPAASSADFSITEVRID